MRDSLPISLEQLRQENLRELFEILEEAFAEFDINYYVLGALARDAWYSTQHIQARATRDVDFAVYVFSGDHYEELKNLLIVEYEFEETEGNPYKLRTPFEFTIDLIPFGIETIDGRIELAEEWDRPVFVNGFEEVAENATVDAIDEEAGLKFRIASLPAIILLKLIAYDDRPENRTQDPEDIREIILNFFDIEDTVIYEEHNDLFEQDLELHEYAAIVIGREIKDILGQNKALRDRILAILSLQDRTQERMVESMINDRVNEEQIIRWFTLISEGIQE